VASRRSGPARLAAALTAVLALAACTAGVPPTGEVVTISPAASTTPAVDPDAIEGGGGPSSGLSESEVALGFLRAMNTGRASAIRNWVLPGARNKVDGWSRRTTIRVYSAFEPGLPYVRDDKRIVPIRVKLSGQLEDGRQWYPATGDQTINLEMGRDGADPRVADPGEVIWMRDVSFERLHAQVEIFMVPDLDGLARRLAPVPVFVPRGNQSDPGAMAERVEDALELLLAGPQGSYDHLDTAIPPGTELRDFRYLDEVATVDLSRELNRASGAGALPVGQIVWTVTRMLQTAQVRILVEGRQIGTIGADRFPAGRPWRRTDEQLARLWPQRSTERDDSVLFVRGGEIYTIAALGIAQTPKVVGLNASGPLSRPTWSPNHRWMAFLVGGGTSQAMWLVQPAGRAFPATDQIQGRLSPPSWSPDSQRIYLVSRSQGRSRLWEVTRSSFTARELDFPELPSGLQPASVAVSPDGTFVLAVADHPRPDDDGTDPGPGGQLFVGQFGSDGVIAWSQRQIAPGLGRVYSPVWVDPVTVAFIAETDTKDDLGKLWVVKSDGWDPTALVNNGTDGGLVADIGHHLTVDPKGEHFVVTVRSSSGASLWAVDREGRTMRLLTEPVPNTFDTDPSYASR
jgi:Sporulation and spore germination